MRLSIDLFTPNDLPSLKKVKEVFRYAAEMGLDEKEFDHTHVRLLQEWQERIVFETSYKHTFIGDTSSNPCLLIVIVEVNEDKLFGRFWIWDPLRKSNIAYSQLLPYKEFVPLLKKAWGIGTLHQDIRAQWYKWKGWEDLLPHVKHAEGQSTE